MSAAERTHRGAAFGVAFAELAARIDGRTGPQGRKLCAWCENELGVRRRVWCRDACADAYWDSATWRGLRSQVARRDRGICRICRTDCRKIRREYAALPAANRAASARRYEIPKRRLRKTWWDADHIVPIAEGGKNELNNLRTLCIRCHKAETKALTLRRASARRPSGPADLLARANALLDSVTANADGANELEPETYP